MEYIKSFFIAQAIGNGMVLAGFLFVYLGISFLTWSLPDVYNWVLIRALVAIGFVLGLSFWGEVHKEIKQ